jgi:uncharacterized protein YjiS (DUF1127 family)
MTHHAGTGAQGHRTLPSTFTLALVGIATRAVQGFVAAVKNRLEVRELYQLDDRALKDIGLMRADVDAALGLPLHLDPSRHLVDVAGDKRGRKVEKPTALVTRERLGRVRSADASVTTAMPAACA